MPRVLLLFLDGVGVGDADAATNPFAAASLPHLRRLLDGHLPVHDTPRQHDRASFIPLDATLGVEGTPQSGTGQTSLLAGFNAAAAHGRHFGPWVPTSLRTRLATESVLARAVAAGHDVAFANAYPEEVLAAMVAPRPPAFLRAAPPLAARAAGVLDRHAEALRTGDAVASEITNDGWIERLGRTELPRIDAAAAGANLARIAAAHDLTFFAHYATDSAGHRQELAAGVAALERVDAFLGGIMAATRSQEDEPLLLIVSDHGNLEDVRAGHTRNPALGIAVGRGHERCAERLRSLVDVAPLVLDLLAVR